MRSRLRFFSMIHLLERTSSSSSCSSSSLFCTERESISQRFLQPSSEPHMAHKMQNPSSQRAFSRRRFKKNSLAKECFSLARVEESLMSLDCVDGVDAEAASAVYSSLLHLCGRNKAFAEGKLVHDHILKHDFKTDVFLDNHLIVMYTRCHRVKEAREVFDGMLIQNTVSWNAMIASYAHHGCITKAFELFRCMQQQGVEANRITFINLLGACNKPELLEMGKKIHMHIVNEVFSSDVFVQNALITMYGRCGSIADACEAFEEMPVHVTSWAAIIAVFSAYGQVDKVFSLVERMQKENIKPNKPIIVSLLNVCAASEFFALDKQIYSHIIKGLESYTIVGNALLNMYWKCGSIENAQKTFNSMSKRDVISWNMMIAAYSQLGYIEDSIKLFHQMQQEGTDPDKVTFFHILSLCSNPDVLAFGKLIHAHAIYAGSESDAFVGIALLNMYAKCMPINDAHEAFCNMLEDNFVSWNVINSLFSQPSCCEEADEIFQQMQANGLKLDKVIFMNLLGTCVNPFTLVFGKFVHALVVKADFEQYFASSLVTMYGMCGSIKDAIMVFDKIPTRDIHLSTSMIATYALHGQAMEALKIFRQMENEGIKPDNVTFLNVLRACSHSNLVNEGFSYFQLMMENYGIIPTLEHYNCMINLLGRVGSLNEAADFINKIPLKSDTMTWMILLHSCRIHHSIHGGQHDVEQVLELTPHCVFIYTVLSNLYDTAGRWDDAAKLRKLIADKAVKKELGRTWVGANNMVHGFVMRDTTHPQREQIYSELERLSQQMKKTGYVPDTNLALHDVEEEQNAEFLAYHSEKLAIVFGLVSTDEGSLYIMKNLRVCTDCHTFIKNISKISARVVVMRDSNRFHYFKYGICSCGDYW